jgi:hypothetical protein
VSWPAAVIPGHPAWVDMPVKLRRGTWAAVQRGFPADHRIIGRLISGGFDDQFGAGLLLRCLTTESVAGWHLERSGVRCFRSWAGR